MFELKADQSSVDSTIDYMQAVKEKILAGVRSGMAEGMVLLAEGTVAEMEDAGIQSRSGQLEANILKSPRVSEDERAIRGRVTAISLVKARGGQLYYNNLGNILDKGAIEPDETKQWASHQIVAADGDTYWARGHVAFDVKPHPFFRRALQVSESPIMDVIRSRIAEATGGQV